MVGVEVESGLTKRTSTHGRDLAFLVLENDPRRTLLIVYVSIVYGF